MAGILFYHVPPCRKCHAGHKRWDLCRFHGSGSALPSERNRTCLFDFLKNSQAQKGLDGIELQVNARNEAAYKMYTNYGFTNKSINMELL